jgi:hypothetical protein
MYLIISTEGKEDIYMKLLSLPAGLPPLVATPPPVAVPAGLARLPARAIRRGELAPAAVATAGATAAEVAGTVGAKGAVGAGVGIIAPARMRHPLVVAVAAGAIVAATGGTRRLLAGEIRTELGQLLIKELHDGHLFVGICTVASRAFLLVTDARVGVVVEHQEPHDIAAPVVGAIVQRCPASIVLLVQMGLG